MTARRPGAGSPAPAGRCGRADLALHVPAARCLRLGPHARILGRHAPAARRGLHRRHDPRRGRLRTRRAALPRVPLRLRRAPGAGALDHAFAIYGVLRVARRSGRNTRNVLIVGTGSRAAQVKRSIDSNPQWGLCILGFLDDVDTPVDPSLFNAKLFGIGQMGELLRDQVVDKVLVAVPRSMLGRLEPVLSACSSTGVPLTMTTDLFGDYMPTPWIGNFGARPTLEFAMVHHNSFMLGVKRTVDVLGASLALMVSAPIVALAAIAIKLEDGGPVFFRQTRCGLFGRRFSMVKLRTMCPDAEARKADLVQLNEMDGPVFKVKLDPRITRVGAFLRRYSLDELPQFWNVLRGEMSLVGPRPPVPEEVIHYEISERRRLSMRPGITCIWQVGGRNEIGFQEWVRLDLEYIDSWSLALDAKILAQTVPAVLLARGAS
ncbi:MAG: sugar transferase [Myxococcota bacterium]